MATTKKQKVYRAPPTLDIKYFGKNKEMYHPAGFSTSRTAADNLAAQVRRRGYYARVAPGTSLTGKKGYIVWESRYARR